MAGAIRLKRDELYANPTFTCLYCGHERSSSTEGSWEHIVPETLGGLYEIDGVCRSCNSTLGRTIDAELFKDPSLSGPAARQGLTGKKGHLRVILSDPRARIVDGVPPEYAHLDLRLRVELTYDVARSTYNLDQRLIPHPINHDRLLVDPRDLHKKRRAGDRRERVVFPESTIRVELSHTSGNLRSIWRAVAKISLAYLSAILGHRFALQPPFDKIRRYICDGKREDEIALTGPVVATALGEQFPLRSDQHSLLLAQADSQILCVIVFFGAITYSVYLGEEFLPEWARNKVVYPRLRPGE